MRIKKLCIIGGGTAGASAALLFQTHLAPHGVEITQIDDESIGPIGVGEATVGHINAFLKLVKLDVFHSMFEKADATVKTAVRLKDFYKKDHSYFTPVASHSLDLSLKEKYNFSDKDFWESFAPIYFAEHGKSPFVINEELDYSVWPEYAWNMDAIKLAEEFRKVAHDRGCKFINDIVKNINVNDLGEITSLELQNNGTMEWDFYIDCSGFHKLLPKKLNLEEILYTDLIPNNRALATQIPYVDQEIELPYLSSVECKGMNAGWRWSIGQQSRLGTGYVYASEFISDEDALTEFIESYNHRFTKDDVRLIKFYTHQSKQHAGPNWILSGLCAGFVEPLESTSIFLSHAALVSALNLMVNGAPASEIEMVKWDPWEISHSWDIQSGSEFLWDNKKAEALTTHVNKMFDTTVKYVLCHYTWSERDDTAYWRSYKNKKDMSTVWAKEFFNDWGSSNIFGSWSFGLLAAGNNYWSTLTDGGIDSYIWNDLNLRQLIETGRITFKDLSLKLTEKDKANLEAVVLGKYTRRKLIYDRHVKNALPLNNQREFLKYFVEGVKSGKLDPSKFLYNEYLN
jgi:flavin-dependent dehydrogenase